MNATKIAALTGGYIVAHAPWVHFAGPQGDDLVRCDAGEFIAVEISVTFEGSCALLTLLREPRGGRLSK